ncbi:MAG: carbon starvation protein A, partial [Spirochaeta sp. LUC14_002_19_P3]
MNTIVLVVIGIAAYVLGVILYSRFIRKGIYKLSESFKTPAHEMQDGVDYVPTNPYILWGHHFTSVAGAAPIIGPAIAVIWGWGPAMLWVVFGTIFFAGIHDMGAIWISVRHKAESIGTISEKIMGRSVSLLFTLIVFLVLLMVNSVFAVAISNSFVANPTSIVPSWGAIVVAIIIGQLIYRLKWNLPLVTIVGVVVLYLLVFAGTALPFSLPETFMGLSSGAVWIIILFVYAALASSLPVWSLLQPRDYINGIQLFIGLIVLYLAFIIGAPQIAAPMFNSELPAGTPPMIPLLFVTIACGAISGFHGLVGSGTTSKQIDKESHIRLVGYGGSLGEGLLALASLLAVSAGFASMGAWRETYSAFGSGGLNGFIQSGANIISSGLKLNRDFAVNLLAVMGILFAGTTMDTGV